MKELRNYKNNKKNRKVFLLFSFLFAFSFIVNKCFAIDIPKLEQYVNDYTNTLTQSQKYTLEKELELFDKNTSNQIVVLIINSLNNETYIEDYSIKVAEQNNIGQKEKDNGVLLTIVKDERKLRIEVGYGLEGFLTDAKSSYIIRNIITPEFKNGDYYSGIQKGLSEIKKVVTDAGYLNDKVSSSNNKTVGAVFEIIIFIIFVILFIKHPRFFSYMLLFGGFNSKNNNKFGGGSFGGGGFGGFHGGGGSFGGGGSSGSW